MILKMINALIINSNYVINEFIKIVKKIFSEKHDIEPKNLINWLRRLLFLCKYLFEKLFGG